MIVVSPSLTDWGEKSARQTIELADYFIKSFSVDSKRIYASGYSWLDRAVEFWERNMNK